METVKRVHFPALDGFRGLAIALVLFEHLVSGRLGWGRLGVQIFFVLSGYLITGILINYRRTMKAGTAARVFYWHRFLRLSPAFYLALAVAGALGIAGSFQTLALAAVYLSNFDSFFRQQWSESGHLWSLAVEEQFYLLFFPLAMLIARNRLQVALLAILGLSFAFNWMMFATGVSLFAILLPGAAHGLAAGGLLAISQKDASGWQWPQALGRSSVALAVSGVLVLALSALSMLSATMKDALLPPFVDVAAVCMIYLCTAKPNSLPARVLALRPLRWLGTISYGLYVYHAFILEAFGLYAPDLSKPLRIAAILSSSLAAAWFSWRYTEKPILSLKGRGPGNIAGAAAP